MKKLKDKIKKLFNKLQRSLIIVFLVFNAVLYILFSACESDINIKQWTNPAIVVFLIVFAITLIGVVFAYISAALDEADEKIDW